MAVKTVALFGGGVDFVPLRLKLTDCLPYGVSAYSYTACDFFARDVFSSVIFKKRQDGVTHAHFVIHNYTRFHVKFSTLYFDYQPFNQIWLTINLRHAIMSTDIKRRDDNEG